jgi:hypothetical protein
MEQLKALSRSRQLILGAGVLLLIDMFFSWQEVSVSFGGEEIAAASRSGWHGFWGVVLGLATIAILLWVAARSFDVEIPGNLPHALITLALGVIIVLCAVLKTLTDDYVNWPAYVGIVLAVIIVIGAWMEFQASGESLPQIPRTAAAAGGAGAATTAAPAEPAPAAEPTPYEPAPEPPSDTEEEPPPAAAGTT